MPRQLAMVGKAFGRWTVLREAVEREGHGNLVYWCRCQCGNKAKVRGTFLRNGRSKQCATCSLEQLHGARRRAAA